MLNKFVEFMYIGILTPILYLVYSVVTILFVFIIGLPIVIGFNLINLAITYLFASTFNDVIINRY